MAIEFSRKDMICYERLWGSLEFNLSVGEKLRLQHGTVGDLTTEMLEEVPEGKTWRVYIGVQIAESDA